MILFAETETLNKLSISKGWYGDISVRTSTKLVFQVSKLAAIKVTLLDLTHPDEAPTLDSDNIAGFKLFIIVCCCRRLTNSLTDVFGTVKTFKSLFLSVYGIIFSFLT